ncbi:hypothetical protein [Sphingobium sp. EM0848]|uniref:hypothetical protein n=1 Tax=Sphingobium sp. EM0848 TaxID=2743473 RepID=UPI00159C0126|nr:hypothetical protein [Sphingobium sp. EM0848]
MLTALTMMMMELGFGPGLFVSWSGIDIVAGTAGVILTILFIAQAPVTGRQLARQDARHR